MLGTRMGKLGCQYRAVVVVGRKLGVVHLCKRSAAGFRLSYTSVTRRKPMNQPLKNLSS
jgi:hypothetical protein